MPTLCKYSFIDLKPDFIKIMLPVSSVFHTEVTVSIGLRVGTSIKNNKTAKRFLLTLTPS